MVKHNKSHHIILLGNYLSRTSYFISLILINKSDSRLDSKVEKYLYQFIKYQIINISRKTEYADIGLRELIVSITCRNVWMNRIKSSGISYDKITANITICRLLLPLPRIHSNFTGQIKSYTLYMLPILYTHINHLYTQLILCGYVNAVYGFNLIVQQKLLYCHVNNKSFKLWFCKINLKFTLFKLKLHHKCQLWTYTRCPG